MAIISQSSLRGLWNAFSGTDRWTGEPPISHGGRHTGSMNIGDPHWEQVQGIERDILTTTAPLATVIARNASMKANGEWKHFKRSASGKKDIEVENSPYVNRLNFPSPLQSRNEFLFDLSVNRNTYGINYTFKDGGTLSNKTIPRMLWNIPPELMTPMFTGKILRMDNMEKIVSSYVFAQGTKAQDTLDTEEILLLRKSFGNYGIIPVSPLSILHMEISNIRAAMGLRNVVFRKKGALGFISSEAKDGEGTLSLLPEERKEIEDQYTEAYGISQKQSKIIVTSKPMKWQAMSFPLKDMMAFEEVNEDVRKIIDFYGSNENLFSLVKGSALSTSGSIMLEAERMVYQDTIIPESKDDAESMSRFLGLDLDVEYLMLDYSDVAAMQENEEMASKVLSNKAMAFERLVRNEVPIKQALEITGLNEILD